MSSQSYKNDQAVRELHRCGRVVERDGVVEFCDLPVADPATGTCASPDQHR